MTKLVDLLDQLKHRRTFGYMDDFDNFVTNQRWKSVETGTGTATVASAVGGILALTPSTAANDATYLISTAGVFEFLPNQPIVFERFGAIHGKRTPTTQTLRSASSDTSDATTSLTASNGGPATSYTGMMFFKKGGTNVWACQSSVGSSQTTTVTSVPAGGANAQTLTGQFEPINSTQAEARFFIDGLLVAEAAFHV